MDVEVEENIRKNVAWAQLPPHIKQLLGNLSEDYDKIVVSFSIKNQLRYRGNLVRHILRDEKRYYERLVADSRERLMLFPYHLADVIVKGLRITPFNYYITVVERLMQADWNNLYDTLPNFTAADCLRVIGLGCNEYNDIMDKSSSNNCNVGSLLPSVPRDVHMEPWWRVEVGLVLEKDVKSVTSEELEVIDRLIDYGSQFAGELNYHIVLSLYKKGLIYIDVPVTAVDRIQVPPLQGFVMNRLLGDNFETLLYKIFVSIDEHITVGELANVLQIETKLVKQAVSLHCRLGFARKLNPETEQSKSKRHPSWTNLPVRSISYYDDISPSTLHLKSSSLDLVSPRSETPNAATGAFQKSSQRIAFLFDYSLIESLMIKNLTPGLKKHLVTMFEVGKLCDESLDSFLSELEKVCALNADGEMFEAICVPSGVLALRKLQSAGLDLVRLECLYSLDEATYMRLLQKKYKLLVSIAPHCREVRPVSSLCPPHLGPPVPGSNSIWFKLFIYHMTGYGPPSLLLIKGTTLKKIPRMFLGYSTILVTAWMYEPVIRPVANIVYFNETLQCSSILLQAYGVSQPAQTLTRCFPFCEDVTAKEQGDCIGNTRQWKNHPAVKNLSEIVDLNHNCGYLIFVNIGVNDLGCPNKDPMVRLGCSNNVKQQKRPEELENSKKPNANVNQEEPTENIDADKLQSSSTTSSPANRFINEDGTNLLKEELDSLDLDGAIDHCKIIVKKKLIGSIPTFTSLRDMLLTSKYENTRVLFGRNQNLMVTGKELSGKCISETKEPEEMWTLLDCRFGIPLFYGNADTRICDAIISGSLGNPSSLDNLKESSRKLETSLSEFISQCRYYTGENMDTIKQGCFAPLPRYNLVFDNGQVSEWSGE